ncbi:MAG: imelysin family protein [Caldilineaceae bacterium]|nr:imelysin family protein [Caldilineaceae bacterium]
MWKRLLCSVLILGALAGCGRGAQAPFDREAMLNGLVQRVIVPVHDAAAAEAATLAAAAHAFADTPTPANLAALQEQWRRTALAWKEAELYAFRDVMILHSQIDKWPTNERFIEGFIAGTERLDAAFAADIGSTSKGLPAVEYLIFDPKRPPDALVADFTAGAAGERRRQYVAALAQDLAAKTAELAAMWAGPDGQGAAFIAAATPGEDLNGSISMLTNEMIVLLEDIAQHKLGDPMGHLSFGVPAPTFVEAGRSGASLALIRADLQGLTRAFHGGDAPDDVGLDDYLTYLDAEYEGQPLAAVISAQIDAALAAVDAVDPPLRVAVEMNPDAVQAAYDAIEQLLVLVKVDMANHLGVTVTFSDNDGD